MMTPDLINDYAIEVISRKKNGVVFIPEETFLAMFSYNDADFWIMNISVELINKIANRLRKYVEHKNK